MNAWPMVTLADIASPEKGAIISGPFGSNIGKRFFVDVGVPVIRGNNLADPNARFTDNGFVYVTDVKAVALKCWAIPDDLIFTAAGSLGQVGLIPQDGQHPRYVISNKQLRVRLDRSKVVPAFAYYYFSSPEMRAYVIGQNKGSSVPLITLGVLRALPIPQPPIAIQQKIATVLSAYDDLIGNNNRRIKLLDEMAQRIYREWFVDFRYPGHEDVPLVESELGLIPEGWVVRQLREVCFHILDGDWIETKDQGGGAYRLLQVSNIGIGSFRETGKYRYISQDTFTRLRCTEVTVGSILVSRMPDPVGRTWYVDHLDEPAITAVDVAILEPNPAVIDPRYCAFYLNSPGNLEYAAQRASGTTRLRITRRDLATFPIVLPSSTVRAAFGAILENCGQAILTLMLQNRNLRTTRDLLLPRLISGEIDVSNLDIAMPEATA